MDSNNNDNNSNIDNTYRNNQIQQESTLLVVNIYVMACNDREEGCVETQYNFNEKS